jgi:phosphate transport system substrate-binding protein
MEKLNYETRGKGLTVALAVMLAAGLLLMGFAACGRTGGETVESGTAGSGAMESGMVVRETAESGTRESGSAGGGTVVIAGSTSVQPLSEMLAETFMEENQKISIEVQGGGSGQGVKAIEEGIADFGALSREVKEEEKEIAAVTYVLAKDGIAVVVNDKSVISDLSIEQMKGIFTGQIANWKELGGQDEKIVVVAREEGSGTRSAFGELTKVIDKDASGAEIDSTVASALIQGSTGAVTQTVAATPGAIGYISLGSLNDTVKAVSVEGTQARTETVLNGTYKLSRPFLYIASVEPAGAAKAWIDFVLSEAGQDIVEEAGFIRVD